MRRSILERFRNACGDGPIARMPPQFISRLLDKLEPHAARNWFKVLKGFCRFCVANELMKADPTASLQRPKVRPSDGHHTFNDEEIAQYEARHLIGSKARLAFALGLYTTQRGGDVVRLGRAAYPRWVTVPVATVDGNANRHSGAPGPASGARCNAE
jgi:hypothetical protein